MKLKFLLTSLILLGFIPVLTFIPVGQKDVKQEMEIYLVSNDIHVGIMLPVTNKIFDWRPFVINDYFKPEIAQEVDWIEFGWGDRRFYFEMPTWEHFTLGLAADALFIPDPAVMHVGLMGGTPLTSEYLRRVRISFKTYEKIVAAVRSSFALKNQKPILIPNRGYDVDDNFFEAHGSYSLIRTCNVWTSDIFASAGLRHPLWSPTKYGMELLWDE